MNRLKLGQSLIKPSECVSATYCVIIVRRQSTGKDIMFILTSVHNYLKNLFFYFSGLY